MTAPTRCRFRWSLRTMFVVVALFGVALGLIGWQYGIVRDRQSMRRWIEAQGGGVPEYRAGLGVKRTDARVPFWREWLGDDTAPVVLLPKVLDADDTTRIKNIFPEAAIIILDDPDT